VHAVDQGDGALGGLEQRLGSSLGAISQRPFSALPSSAAKHAAESKRGTHNQSIEPDFATKPAPRQSPIKA
jgi:hypothetical protein